MKLEYLKVGSRYRLQVLDGLRISARLSQFSGKTPKILLLFVEPLVENPNSIICVDPKDVIGEVKDQGDSTLELGTFQAL